MGGKMPETRGLNCCFLHWRIGCEPEENETEKGKINSRLYIYTVIGISLVLFSVSLNNTKKVPPRARAAEIVMVMIIES